MGRPLKIAFGLAGIFAVAAVLWYFVLRPPTPRDATVTAFDRALAGDVAWLYEHTTQKERELVSLETLKEFHAAFVGPEVKDAVILSMEDRHLTDSQATLRYTLRLKDGSRVDSVTFAFFEDGRMVAPAFETLFYLYAGVKHRDIPIIVDRLEPAWNTVGPWLQKRGVQQWYSSQDDGVYGIRGVN
jgi:hypothetical protein